MREFILKARKAEAKNFNTNDLTSAGRMDLVARCISNALFVSNQIRKDTIIHVVLEGAGGPKTVSINGDIKGWDYDEKSIAKKILKAIKRKTLGEIEPGLYVTKKSFEQIVKEKQNIIYLDKKGEDVRKKNFKKVTIVLGDYIGIPKKTKKFLDQLNAEKISLGKTTYFASQAITIMQNQLDRNLLR